MNRIQRNLPLTGASLLAAGLMLGVAGTASAVDITGNLTNVSGPVQSGSASGDRGSVTALLDFTVPSGEFGDDANALAGSSNPVDFSTTLNGTIQTGLAIPNFENLDSTLNASNSFSSGMALADFLLGNSGSVDFDSATITSGPVVDAMISSPTARILDPTFGGDGSQTIANLTGGTLDLAGNQSTLASLSIDGQLVDGDGTINATGMVAEGGGGDNGTPPGGGGGDNGTPPGGGGGDNGTPPGGGGGMTDVPTPSGLGTMMLLGLGLVGIGAAKRRQGKNRGNTTALAA